jgi:hypothetical protein
LATPGTLIRVDKARVVQKRSRKAPGLAFQQFEFTIRYYLYVHVAADLDQLR